jgi:SP family sugar:H+ symporter-like MFS transporter
VLKLIYFDQYVGKELAELEAAVNPKQISTLSYGDLLSPKYRGKLLVGCLLSCLQQFSGINAVIYYSTAMFAEVNIIIMPDNQ